MDPRYLAIIPSVAVIVLIGAGFFIRSILRSWGLPKCWHCGAPKVRPSRSEQFIDVAAAMILLRPFRCQGCRVRFYGPRFFGSRTFTKRAKPSPAPALEHSPARRLQTQNPV
jgi:hypothetical protein